MTEDHIVIVGGGVMGLCSAYYLNQRGVRVTLLEQGTIADTASTGNAGIIALGHLPLPRPGLVKQALKWMFDQSAPLYIRPRLDIGLWRWILLFRRACKKEHVDHCMEMLSLLGREAIKCWQQIVEDENLECAYQQCGWHDVYRSNAGREHALRDAETIAGYGFDVQQRSGDELRSADPAFSEDVLGGVCYSESAIVDPVRFMVQLADRLEQLGVTIHQNTPVEELLMENKQCKGVRVSGGEQIKATSVVLAAGSWSSLLTKSIGMGLPMQPGKGYYLDLGCTETSIATACVLNEAFIAVTPMGDHVRLAGTVELSGLNQRIIQQRLDMLLSGAKQYFQGLDTVKVKSQGCALRPCTSDGLPVIGPVPHISGLYLATGHAKMGLTHGPITGRLVSEGILDNKTSLDITSLSADRFQ